MAWVTLILGKKVATQSQQGATTREACDAVTINATKFLGREDLGRLAPGTNADLIMVDLCRVAIGPHFDSIRSLVYYSSIAGGPRCAVDGRAVVRDHNYLSVNEADVVDRAQGVLGNAISTLTS